jgi:hypothetical protein
LIKSKIELVTRPETQIMAEDDEGHAYDYGHEGFPKKKPTVCASEWFGVEPQGDDWL